MYIVRPKYIIEIQKNISFKILKTFINVLMRKVVFFLFFFVKMLLTLFVKITQAKPNFFTENMAAILKQISSGEFKIIISFS